MRTIQKEWTHKDIEIVDIRKLFQLYVIKINCKDIDKPLFVNEKIFKDRLKTYFLVNDVNNITRKDILNLKWNLYITKGEYIKIQNGEAISYNDKCDPEKYYVSFLEIAGPLGSFESVYK